MIGNMLEDVRTVRHEIQNNMKGEGVRVATSLLAGVIEGLEKLRAQELHELHEPVVAKTCPVCAPPPPKLANYEASGGREQYGLTMRPILWARRIAMQSLLLESTRLSLEYAREPTGLGVLAAPGLSTATLGSISLATAQELSKYAAAFER
jgi:hypothetical protein